MLTLHNNLTKENELFKPLEYGKVKMFTCGPSVYQRQHIGNYRTFLFEDILLRYLEYLGYRVTRALNFTDIEDKSIKEAKKQTKDVLEITGKSGRQFFDELTLLKARPPDHNPKSSTSVDEAVKIIKDLLEKGLAYWHKGNVYFDTQKFRDFGKLGKPDMSRMRKKRRFHKDTYPGNYWNVGDFILWHGFHEGDIVLWDTQIGKLGKPDMSRMLLKKRRFHKDTYPGNYWNVGDFILWHGFHEGDIVFWDTQIGKGRPGWNVQDPAMIIQTLGTSIDICCGGEDNLVRHHDYTIAVAESVSGKELAHYWLHAGHLLTNGRKMSKSKGNIIYIEHLLDAGYTAEEIRFFFIFGRYGKRLNFTYDRIKKTTQKLRETVRLIDIIQHVYAGESDSSVHALLDLLRSGFEKNMDNNLDVKRAFDDMSHTLSALERLVGKNRISSKDAGRIIEVLERIDSVLQVLQIAEPHART